MGLCASAPTNGNVSESSGAKGSGTETGDKQIQNMMEAKQRALRRRRVNIVAESYDVDTNVKTVVVHKSKNARTVIRAALDKHFIFSTTTPKDLEEMIDSMEEVNVDAGVVLINQGEKGDRFYVCESGSFTVIVDGKQVAELPAGSSFGELALMDDSPRAATLRCKSKAKLWALGRQIFRRILANNTQRTLNDNLQFLKGVKLLKALTRKELGKLAEALQPVPFSDGTKIVSQGEEGNTFYIVSEGTCIVSKRQDDGTETQVMELNPGDHFGERALQRNEPRAATVIAVGDVRCMALDRQSFTELLGSLEDILKVEHSKRLQLEKASMNEAAGDGSSSLRQDIKLQELRTIATLGQGAFGQVKLVQHKKTKQVFALKVLQCAKVVRTKQEQNVVNEKKLMMECDHPYILKLYATFRDRACVYLLLEFLQGGDLFGHMAKLDFNLTTKTARHYAAIVTTAFDYMHSRGIVYRDLKPENLVMDRKGHMKIVDFGFAKRVDGLTYTLCGTPEYLAPEIVSGKGHNKGADYWALGILIYELTYGNSPFAVDSGEQMVIYKNIIRNNLKFPNNDDRRVITLIRALLTSNMSKRLGLQRGGAKDIMAHPWFKSIDFDALLRQELKPPIIPDVAGDCDTQNFEIFDPEDEPPAPFQPTQGGFRWEREFG